MQVKTFGKFTVSCLVSLLLSCKSSSSGNPQHEDPSAQPTGGVDNDPGKVGVKPEIKESQDYTLTIQAKSAAIAEKPQTLGRLELKRKGVVSSLVASLRQGKCVGGANETAPSSGLYSLTVHCKQKETCQLDWRLLMPTAQLDETIPLEVACIEGKPEDEKDPPVPGATPASKTIVFTDPMNGRKVTGSVEGTVAAIMQTRGELLGTFKTGANINIRFVILEGSTLQEGCKKALDFSKTVPELLKYPGYASGATFLGFQQSLAPPEDLVQAAKDAADKAGFRGVTSVVYMEGDDYYGYRYLANSLSDFVVKAGQRVDAKDVIDTLQLFLRRPKILTDYLPIGTLCDMVNGAGVIAEDKDGNPGPVIHLSPSP